MPHTYCNKLRTLISLFLLSGLKTGKSTYNMIQNDFDNTIIRQKQNWRHASLVSESTTATIIGDDHIFQAIFTKLDTG